MKKFPLYDFILCWKESGAPKNKVFTNEDDSLAHANMILEHVTDMYLYYPDGQSRKLTQKAAS